jgi:D,D-heptose 1,7-bisphosphate phosphatase
VSGGVGNQRAVFLDRDGTLIREVGHLHRRDQVEILPRVPEAIRLLRARGFCVVVVSNQSAVARGLLTEEELGIIHEELNARLAQEGAHLDGIYYCPHHPERGFTDEVQALKISCDCRKPATGMLDAACREFNIDRTQSFLIGDSTVDTETARRAGLNFRGVQTGYGCQDSRYPPPDSHTIYPDLLQAVTGILGSVKN